MIALCLGTKFNWRDDYPRDYTEIIPMLKSLMKIVNRDRVELSICDLGSPTYDKLVDLVKSIWKGKLTISQYDYKGFNMGFSTHKAVEQCEVDKVFLCACDIEFPRNFVSLYDERVRLKKWWVAICYHIEHGGQKTDESNPYQCWRDSAPGLVGLFKEDFFFVGGQDPAIAENVINSHDISFIKRARAKGIIVEGERCPGMLHVDHIGCGERISKYRRDHVFINICVPVFNYSKMLLEVLIPSLLKVKRRDRIILSVVDSKSTDIADLEKAIIKACQRKLGGIVFSQRPGKFSVSINQNDAVMQTYTEKVFLCAGDIMLPENFIELYDSYVTDNQIWAPVCYHIPYKKEVIVGTPGGSWRRLAKGLLGMKKNVFWKLGGHNESLDTKSSHEDSDLWKRIRASEFKTIRENCENMFHICPKKKGVW